MSGGTDALTGIVAAVASTSADLASLVAGPFRTGPPPTIRREGNLVVAWRPGPRRSVEDADGVVCVLQGSLYDSGGLADADANGSRSPAASLASAFRRLGPAVLDPLRGDFWLLLWDVGAGRGLVAADQMGGHCPYWSRTGAGFVVASEVRDLVPALPRRPPPDHVAMAHWLGLTAPPYGQSLFDGVRRLEAGHFLEIGAAAHAEPRRWWAPPFRGTLQEPREELVARLRDQLLTSADRRTADAARPGVLLSGGLDSSAVTGFATHVLDGARRPRAYSATFPDHATVDESHLIDVTTGELGLASTRIVVRGGSLIAGALRHLDVWQVPPTSPNLFFWMPLLERAGADGVDVMLDGEGGDELFGLSPFLLADELLRGRFLTAAHLAHRFPGGNLPPRRRKALHWLRHYGLKPAVPTPLWRAYRRARGPRDAPRWMRPETAAAWFETDTEPLHIWRAIDGPRWWALMVEIVTRGVGPALVYEQSRRRSALAGVEARHPLVDVDVIELMLRMPPEAAYDTRFSRPLLREALAGLIPDEVRLRPAKSNFDAVFHAEIAGRDLPVARRLLGRDARVGAYVDLDVVEQELLAVPPPQERRPRQRWAISIWRLVTAECWLRLQEDASFAANFTEREGLGGVDGEVVAVRTLA